MAPKGLGLQINQILLNDSICNLLTLDVVCARIDRFGKLVDAIQPYVRLRIHKLTNSRKLLTVLRDLNDIPPWRNCGFSIAAREWLSLRVITGLGLYL